MSEKETKEPFIMPEYDLSNITWVIKRVGKMLDWDPLIGQAEELGSIERKFTEIQEAIEWVEWKERTWIITNLFSNWFSWDKDFHFWNFEGKIASIFSKYDLIWKSVINIKDMYEEFSKELEEELERLNNFLDELPDREEVYSNLSYKNYASMSSNLELSLSRVKEQYNSCATLCDVMRSGRPAFEVILSSCMIEVAGNKTLDSSAKMMEIMSKTAEGLSDKLTEQTIRQSGMALEVSSKPALAESNIAKNKLLLSEAMESISSARQLAAWETKEKIITKK